MGLRKVDEPCGDCGELGRVSVWDPPDLVYGEHPHCIFCSVAAFTHAEEIWALPSAIERRARVAELSRELRRRYVARFSVR